MSAGDRKRLVVFSDDWGRHPSSAQHLVRELLPRWDVDWVNTVGTRRPRLTRADLARGLEKLREWTRREPRAEGRAPRSPAARAPRVHSPVLWPGFGTRLERALNLTLLTRALRDVLRPAPDAVVTTASLFADLARHTPDLCWVYYCVDDLSEWPGLDAATLRSLELELLPRVERVVCVSEHLRARLAGLGRPDATLLTHGIELAHWQPLPAAPPRPADAPPRAVFWGHADRRLDADIVLALAAACELELVGPRGALDPRLADDARIRWRGALPYADLPAVAAGADVLVMPYADLPVTRAMQPLKLKEYLATGKPVVATPLPANLEWADALDLEADPAAFARRVLERARAPLPAAQVAARERLAGEGWDAKARAFERVLLGLDGAEAGA